MLRIASVPTDQLSRYKGLPSFFGRVSHLSGRTELSQRIMLTPEDDPAATPYIVESGDRIDLLAKELGDPRLFWVIADLNPGVDLLKLTPGATIFLPSETLLARVKASLG